MMREKKSMSFPLWAEAILIVTMGAMAVIETENGAWGWAIVFVGGFLTFGISAVARALTGDKHGGA
jgi:hypothetical protein